MAIQTKTIKQKMKSVGNIKKITKTMEMVSVSKMKKAISLALASKEYFKAALNLLSFISKETYLKSTNFFFRKKLSGKKLVLVIASDKGLCGSYNSNIFKALSLVKKRFGEELECVTAGKYAEKAALRLGIKISASFIRISEQNPIEEIKSLTNLLIKDFKEKNYQSVSVLYTEFIRSSKFSPVLKELLPIKTNIFKNMLEDTEQGEETKENLALYNFEPGEETILDMVIPRLLESTIYQMFLESRASEHSARMFAMKAASDNAASMLDDLTLSFNYARQDIITRELSEIVGGAAALEAV